MNTRETHKFIKSVLAIEEELIDLIDTMFNKFYEDPQLAMCDFHSQLDQFEDNGVLNFEYMVRGLKRKPLPIEETK